MRDYKTVLKLQPWLRYVDSHSISSKLLTYTHGDIFIAFNTLSQNYELHSVKSFYISGFSQNAVIDPEYVNGFIYTDYRANELRKFLYDVVDRREKNANLYDRHEAMKNDLHGLYKSIERTMGTKV